MILDRYWGNTGIGIRIPVLLFLLSELASSACMPTWKSAWKCLCYIYHPVFSKRCSPCIDYWCEAFYLGVHCTCIVHLAEDRVLMTPPDQKSPIKKKNERRTGWHNRYLFSPVCKKATGKLIKDCVLLRTLRSNDADGNENVKKTIGFTTKTATLHVHHARLYISLPAFARLRRKNT